MAAPERLFSRDFILLNLIFFVASIATAIFFQFHRYLSFLGIPEGWSGFIIAADAIPALILQPLLGVFLNNNNARRWMFGGVTCMIAALLSYGFATTVTALVAVRIFQGAGFACLIAAMMVLMVNYIPSQKSGTAFGIVSTIRLLPYALIPPLMSGYFKAPQDFLKALTYSVLPMVLSLMAVLLLKSPDILPGGPGPRQSINKRELLEDLKDRRVSIVLVINLLLYSGYTTVFFFLEGYDRKMGIENPGLFFTIATMTMIGVRVFGSTLFDKINKVYLTLCGMAGLVVCYAALPLTSFYSFFYILAFFTGLGWGIVMPVLNALMFEVSVPPFRGLNLNLSLVMMQGGFFVGPFLGGLVHGWWGYNMLFYFCASLSLLSAAFAWRLSHHVNEGDKSGQGRSA
ncbi:MAG: MFS transporter [Proteobacteria bacterium]|nr:MFS transporter [Pseudomonadota bacterium]